MSDNKAFTPLVSIIIPVYNGSNYMREAIDSALTQTYGNIEVIVVNDGSNDNTEEIAKSYANKIRYYKKKNGGVASALNLAIEKAKGDYISWLSHDDVYYPDKIEKQVKAINKSPDPNVSIVWSDFEFIDSESNYKGASGIQLHNISKLNTTLYPLFNGILNGCTLLIPKIMFNKNSFDENLKYTQDYDLWLRIFPNKNMVFINETLVKSRQHNQQTSKINDGRIEELDLLWSEKVASVSKNEINNIYGDTLKFYKALYEYIKSNNRSIKAETKFANLIKKELKRKISAKEDLIVVNIATFSGRKSSIEKTINSILSQCDILNIYINDYTDIPEFLKDPRINVWFGEKLDGDLRDSGKFYFLKTPIIKGYHFTIDDDIEYPIDYCSSMIKILKSMDNKPAIGVHGIIFDSNFSNFIKSRKITFHFTKKLDKNFYVSTLGTGTMATHSSNLRKLNLKDFKNHGMADLYFAKYCKENKIPLVAVNRPSNWLKPIRVADDKNLFDESIGNTSTQDNVIANNKLWEYSTSGIDNAISLNDVLVSIIIPFKKNLDWLKEAISSCKYQTHSNIEIIIINDNSEENLIDVKSVNINDQRLKVIDNINVSGPAGARNTGLSVAKGEYISFLDSDDLFFKNKIEYQLLYMLSRNLDFTHTSYESFDDQGSKKTIESGKINFSFPEIISRCSIACPTVMIRRQIIIENKYKFPEKYLTGQDVCFWIDIAQTYQAVGINKVLTKVRIHGNNVAYNPTRQAIGISNILNHVMNNYYNYDNALDIFSLSNKLNAFSLAILKKAKVHNTSMEQEQKLNQATTTKSGKLKRMIKRMSPTYRIMIAQAKASEVRHEDITRRLEMNYQNESEIIKILKNNSKG